MKYSKPTFKPYGERGILVEWETKINEEFLQYILSLKKTVVRNRGEVIVDIINTYHSLLIIYNSTINNIYDEIFQLNLLFQEKTKVSSHNKRLFHLPVCYDKKFGLDLDFIAAKKNLSSQEIITRHSSRIYTLYFMGFLPGFLYLGKLEKSLEISRKNQPRKRVEKGAVGIAENQTGIYPKPAPGGWQIIGNCPLELFQPNQNPPSIFTVGDKIKFYPVPIEEYRAILESVRVGKFQPKIKMYGD